MRRDVAEVSSSAMRLEGGSVRGGALAPHVASDLPGLALRSALSARRASSSAGAGHGEVPSQRCGASFNSC